MPEGKIVEVKNQQGIRDIESLANQIWPEYYIPMIGASQVDYMLKHFQSASAISAQIKEGYRYFLIRADNEYVGYFSIYIYEKKGELFISKLYIKSNQRGKGFGKQAMGFIEAFARGKTLTEITLMVNKTNFSARQFYEQNGFINTAPVVKDIGGGFVMDDYLYTKKLTNLWEKTSINRKIKRNFFSDDPTRIYYFAVLVTFVLLFLFIFFPKPQPTSLADYTIDISKTPYQSEVVYTDVIVKNLLGANFVIKPVATYRISGLILGKYYYMPFSAWDRLAPIDLTIAWGDLPLPENSKYVAIEHTMRSHELKVKPGSLFDRKYLIQHASFNHIIGANTNVLDAVTSLKVSQKVTLEGFLVNVINISVPGNQQWTTSLKRNDDGPTSCEILYVTKVTVGGKVYE